MPTKNTLVQFEHDTGYGDSLLSHINNAIRGKDMRAVSVGGEAEPAEVAAAVDRLKSTWNLTSKIVDEAGHPKMEWVECLAVIVDHYLSIREMVRGAS